MAIRFFGLQRFDLINHHSCLISLDLLSSVWIVLVKGMEIFLGQ